jgi:AcrR family transcriptional regulator
MNHDSVQQRSSRKEAKRSQIVAIAKKMFFANGFASTSMAQISAKVGGSKATLYNHFESKDELLIAVVEDVLKPINTSVAEGPSPEDFRVWLRWFGIMGLTRILADDVVAVRRIAAAEAHRFPEFARIFYETGVLPAYAPVAVIFSRAMERGILRRAEPRECAMMFIDMCSGWPLRLVEWNIGPKPNAAEIEARVDFIISIFLDGMTPR